MLEIIIPSQEFFDEKAEEFFYVEGAKLELEHSLHSLSKWESKWCKPFLTDKPKTSEETLDYIKSMTLNENVDPNIYNYITVDQIDEINKYIEAPMTATFFSDKTPGKKSREIITNEIIYYWLIALNIPFECQYWHLNRLLTLIRVCNIKNQPPKKRSKREILSQNAALNEARRKQLNSRG